MFLLSFFSFCHLRLTFLNTQNPSSETTYCPFKTRTIYTHTHMHTHARTHVRTHALTPIRIHIKVDKYGTDIDRNYTHSQTPSCLTALSLKCLYNKMCYTIQLENDWTNWRTKKSMHTLCKHCSVDGPLSNHCQPSQCGCGCVCLWTQHLPLWP